MRNTTATVLAFIMIIFSASAIKFRRKIDAVGYSYYKILLTLGSCKEKLLFSEKKIWGSVLINRLFDIYYKSSIEDYKVSRVDIFIAINHSDVLAYSQDGVGSSTFAATVYLPMDTVVIFYSLKIYTCSHPSFETADTGENRQRKPFLNIGDYN